MIADPKLTKTQANEAEGSAENGVDVEAENEDASGAGVVNLQKRKGDVEPTRYGDWELNGRCIDF